MVRRGVKWTVAALAFAAACAPTTGEQPPSAPNRGASGPWELTLHMSGGFAGVDRTLELASTGAIRASDRRRSAPASSQATEQELAQIASLVAALGKPSAAPRAADCNDCFEYALDVGRGNERFMFELDDVTLGGSSLQPLVNALVTVLNRALAGS